nr:vacuolar protein sorting-associated protein Ist1 [Tanacetum cinerariifolium]
MHRTGLTQWFNQLNQYPSEPAIKLGIQDTTPADNDVETSSATLGDISSSETTSERMEMRENWNMEFKKVARSC